MAEYSAQVKKVLQKAGNLEAMGARELKALMEELRQAVTLAIVHEEKLDPFTLDRVKEKVNQALLLARGKLTDTLSENQRRQFVKGVQMVDAEVTSQDMKVAMPYLSTQKLEQVKKYGADLVTGLTDDLRKKLADELNLAVLGQKPLQDVLKGIGKNLNGPSTFGTVTRRTLAVYKTEMSRIQNIAATERMKQLSTQMPMFKQWVHSYQGVPRVGHLDLNGVQVEANEKFTLEGVNGGTFKVDGPHDPILPPEEVVNCRCFVIPVVRRDDAEVRQGTVRHKETKEVLNKVTSKDYPLMGEGQTPLSMGTDWNTLNSEKGRNFLREIARGDPGHFKKSQSFPKPAIDEMAELSRDERFKSKEPVTLYFGMPKDVYENAVKNGKFVSRGLRCMTDDEKRAKLYAGGGDYFTVEVPKGMTVFRRTDPIARELEEVDMLPGSTFKKKGDKWECVDDGGQYVRELSKFLEELYNI